MTHSKTQQGKKGLRCFGMVSTTEGTGDELVIPLAADEDILADLHATNVRRLLDKILDVFTCRHRWDLVLPSPDGWSRWDFVNYRTMMPDISVFRRRIANTLQCDKCGECMDVSSWEEDAARYFTIGRRYLWVSRIYFELMASRPNIH